MGRVRRLGAGFLLVCSKADAGLATAPQAGVAVLRVVDGCAFRPFNRGVGPHETGLALAVGFRVSWSGDRLALSPTVLPSLLAAGDLTLLVFFDLG